MLVRLGKKKEDTYPARLEMIFKTQVLKSNEWLKSNYNVAYLYVNYSDAIENPMETAKKVQQFLGLDMNLKNMAAVVDKSLYREKIEKS
jgi:hypothetical protein